VFNAVMLTILAVLSNVLVPCILILKIDPSAQFVEVILSYTFVPSGRFLAMVNPHRNKQMKEGHRLSESKSTRSSSYSSKSVSRTPWYTSRTTSSGGSMRYPGLSDGSLDR
jgi:hypothetical protein